MSVINYEVATKLIFGYIIECDGGRLCFGVLVRY